MPKKEKSIATKTSEDVDFVKGGAFDVRAVVVTLGDDMFTLAVPEGKIFRGQIIVTGRIEDKK